MILKESDIGKWFTYVSFGGKEEKGKLKSFDNKTKTAYIVYKANGNWDGDHWKDYTAECTNYSDIKELKIKKEIHPITKHFNTDPINSYDPNQ